MVDEMDRHPLVAGDVHRVGGRPRVEQDIFEAAERDEGTTVIRTQVQDTGLHDGAVQLALGGIAV